jgi:nicotinamidase-related amidase
MDEIISKNSTNAFFSVPISYEASHNYIITGCCTDICIYQYAVTLLAYFNENGIDSNVIVIKPLIDTFNMEGHDADSYNSFFINSMVAAGVQVAEEAPLFI